MTPEKVKPKIDNGRCSRCKHADVRGWVEPCASCKDIDAADESSHFAEASE